MKKLLAAGILFSLLLTGCGGNPYEEPKETIAPETSLAAESENPSEALDVFLPMTILFRQDNMDGYDESGEKKLLDFDFQWLEVKTPENPEIGEKITEDLERETRSFYEGVQAEEAGPIGAEESLRIAREGYQMMKDDFYPYAVERTYSPSHRGKILTVRSYDYVNLGGAHGSHSAKYLCYDSLTGEKLHLEDLSDQPENFREILLQKMVQIAETDPEVSGAINWLEPDQYEEGFKPLLRDGAWHLDGDYLIISSQEYELGPYAAGTVNFKIPVSEIQSFLNPEYNRNAMEPGVLSVQEETALPLAGQISSGTYQTRLFLAPEGTVYDVCLQKLKTMDGGNTFLEGAPLWYCVQMKGCALEVSAEIPELIPDLMVSYRNADGILFKQALVQSGEDGHCYLMDIKMN